MVKNNSIIVLSEAIKQINLNEDDVNEIILSISSIHLFDDVLDFRQASKIVYPLKDILLMAFLVILDRGKQNFNYIADYVAFNAKKFVGYGLLTDTNKTPSHDTFRRVFSLLDPYSLQKVTINRLYEFLVSIESKQKGLSHLAIDGKTVNGTGRSKNTNNPRENYNVLNVYSSTYNTCLYSSVIDDKTNEIPTARDALNNFNLKNIVVTADALHLQSETIKLIKDKGGHYLITCRDNQPLIHQEVMAKFNNTRLKKSIKTISQDKYSIEVLRLPSSYQGFDKYPSFKSFVKLISNKNPKKEIVRYFVTDLVKLDEIEYAVNERWKIENDLHKLKDTFLHEDEFRCIDRNAVKNIVTMNNLIAQLINIYYPLSGYDLRVAKIALSTNTYNEIIKLLAILSSETIKDKLIEAINKKYSKKYSKKH